MSIFNVCNRYSCIGHSVVDDCIHRHGNWILCQYLLWWNIECKCPQVNLGIVFNARQNEKDSYNRYKGNWKERREEEEREENIQMEISLGERESFSSYANCSLSWEESIIGDFNQAKNQWEEKVNFKKKKDEQKKKGGDRRKKERKWWWRTRGRSGEIEFNGSWEQMQLDFSLLSFFLFLSFSLEDEQAKKSGERERVEKKVELSLLFWSWKQVSCWEVRIVVQVTIFSSLDSSYPWHKLFLLFFFCLSSSHHGSKEGKTKWEGREEMSIDICMQKNRWSRTKH